MKTFPLFLVLLLNSCLTHLLIRAAGHYITRKEWYVIALVSVVISAVVALTLGPIMGPIIRTK